MADGVSPRQRPDRSPDLVAKHEAMVAELAARGIADENVLAAMATVRREHYVDRELASLAYADQPLPIGSGQTISQPYMVAAMAEAAEIAPTDRVLEIGTGSGYGAAVLAELAGRVWTIERLPALADLARQRLLADGRDEVEVIVGDGSAGWPPAAPYDAIVATACPPEIPPALNEQLADGGRLIIPVGPKWQRQTLVRVRRQGDALSRQSLGAVRFVPLVVES
jgi:protein-L-isoaspartate(D-aspartate) O-methyltransferase